MVKSFVQFHNGDRVCPIHQKSRVKSFIAQLVFQEAMLPCQLQYVFCSDEFLHRMNLSYLNHDDYTDIITFDLSEDTSSSIVGEIYISVDRVKENAANFGVALQEEILRVVFHGALHLCGYKDKTKAETKLMRSKEELYLDKYRAESSTWNK